MAVAIGGSLAGAAGHDALVEAAHHAADARPHRGPAQLRLLRRHRLHGRGEIGPLQHFGTEVEQRAPRFQKAFSRHLVRPSGALLSLVAIGRRAENVELVGNADQTLRQRVVQLAGDSPALRQHRLRSSPAHQPPHRSACNDHERKEIDGRSHRVRVHPCRHDAPNIRKRTETVSLVQVNTCKTFRVRSRLDATPCTRYFFFGLKDTFLLLPAKYLALMQAVQ